MKISAIKIEAHPDPDAQVVASAEITLNGSLTLRGIKILRGRYGLFLAFPGLREGLPQRAFEALSMRFRKELQAAVLQSYRESQSSPISLFPGCAR